MLLQYSTATFFQLLNINVSTLIFGSNFILPCKYKHVYMHLQSKKNCWKQNIIYRRIWINNLLKTKKKVSLKEKYGLLFKNVLKTTWNYTYNEKKKIGRIEIAKMTFGISSYTGFYKRSYFPLMISSHGQLGLKAFENAISIVEAN